MKTELTSGDQHLPSFLLLPALTMPWSLSLGGVTGCSIAQVLPERGPGSHCEKEFKNGLRRAIEH